MTETALGLLSDGISQEQVDQYDGRRSLIVALGMCIGMHSTGKTLGVLGLAVERI